MNYKEALDYIHGTMKFGVKLGLHNINYLLELMGNPHKKLKYIHVAGTNGKGSTVAFISSILIEAGYKVGIYTSPYIERFTERIKINHDEIDENKLAAITGMVREKVELMIENGQNHPTEFEIVTAIAFQYFCENNCDIVVLEVGLGGRFDSTNVIEAPLASVITTINYDHMGILGDTLSQIAFEKAGIIKNNCDTVLYPQVKEVSDVINKVCNEKGSTLHEVDFSGITVKSLGMDGQTFDYCFKEDRGEKFYESLEISLLGDHQAENAVVALNAINIITKKGFNISEKDLRDGLLKAKWPGRLEVLNKKPVFVVDGAHNAQGAVTLSKALDKYFPSAERRIYIIGVLKDKDYSSIISALVPDAYAVIAVTPKSERALKACELENIIKSYCNNVIVSDTIDDAVKTSFKIASEDDLICSFGSLYYIGEVREYFRNNS